MTVPVHILGAEEAPGVTLESGIMMQGINQIDVACLANDLPEFLEVNVVELGMGEAVHLSDLQLPKGVELATPVEAGAEDDHAVANVVAPKKPQTVEEPVEGEEGASEAEGDAAE